jgi:hypothetical protein
VATDADGNVYIAGQTCGPLGGPTETLDGWIAKYSTTGVLLWKRQFGDPWNSDDLFSGVATDGDGNVYIAAIISNDGAVVKYSAAGALLWTQLGPFFDGFAYHQGVATDGDGNVYVTGGTAGCPCDAYVEKFLPTGALRWARTLESSPRTMRPTALRPMATATFTLPELLGSGWGSMTKCRISMRSSRSIPRAPDRRGIARAVGGVRLGIPPTAYERRLAISPWSLHKG